MERQITKTTVYQYDNGQILMQVFEISFKKAGAKLMVKKPMNPDVKLPQNNEFFTGYEIIINDLPTEDDLFDFISGEFGLGKDKWELISMNEIKN